MSTHTVRAAGRIIELGERPWLMGIVNASPDSFSDGGMYSSLDAQVQLARDLLADGADILDIGGESASTGRPPVQEREEIERVAPLIARVCDELGALVSVDTYKPAVAQAAIEAGASIINDVSGLRDPELADVCAGTGAALVVMHTSAAPRVRLQDPDLYDDVTGEVMAFLRERSELALSRGVEREQLILDPGPDFTKTPAQTIRLLSEIDRLARARPPAAHGHLSQGLHRRPHRALPARARSRDARGTRARRAARRPHLPRARRRRRRRLPGRARRPLGP